MKYTLVALICALFLLFAVNNRAHVAISLFPLPYEAEMPLFLLSILIFCSGLLVGGALISMKTFRLHRLLLHARHRAGALENELQVVQTKKDAARLPAAPVR